ncbi:DUF6801 domain-containing protein [Flexivirga meconopsidis]|uniref:DUF6801 domain-containing protein n=1 Tax=Flexivirga meconopsidis TaxID=2977121 RepID=UPI00223F2886|nr:DUF6801 domain-containing protein [Flexivirga meconopsidis]
MKQRHTSRSLRRSAAIAAPILAAGLATAAVAPSAQAAPGPTKTYTASLSMGCKATSPIAVDLGTWTGSVSVDLPSSAASGDQLAPPPLKATINVPGSATSAMSLIGAKNILSGTAKAPYSVTGAVASPGNRSANLTVANTPIPITGGQPVTTTATGVGQAETASGSGNAVVQIQSPISIALVTDSPTSPNVAVTCTLPSPVTLATIPVS